MPTRIEALVEILEAIPVLGTVFQLFRPAHYEPWTSLAGREQQKQLTDDSYVLNSSAVLVGLSRGFDIEFGFQLLQVDVP